MKLGIGLAVGWRDGELDRQACELSPGNAKGIGSNEVDSNARSEAGERLGHSRQEPAVERQRAVVVQDEVGQLELAEARDVDRDHRDGTALRVGCSANAVELSRRVDILARHGDGIPPVTAHSG